MSTIEGEIGLFLHQVEGDVFLVQIQAQVVRPDFGTGDEIDGPESDFLGEVDHENHLGVSLVGDADIDGGIQEILELFVEEDGFAGVLLGFVETRERVHVDQGIDDVVVLGERVFGAGTIGPMFLTHYN